MKIGIVKEIKDHEYRVAATPSAVSALVKAGHKVLFESKAGMGINHRCAAKFSRGASSGI